MLNSLLASDFFLLLIIFANSLDPDQDWVRQNIGPDLDPNCFDADGIFLKEFFKKVNFEKNQQTTKKHAKLPSRQKVKVEFALFFR